MKKIWINKADSFVQAEEFEQAYYSKMTGSERLEIVQLLRVQYQKMKKGRADEGRKGLRRVLKIVEQE